MANATPGSSFAHSRPTSPRVAIVTGTSVSTPTAPFAISHPVPARNPPMTGYGTYRTRSPSRSVPRANFALGTLRLGDLVRYVPYPVIGGFLAGTGWLIAKGAVGVLTDVPVTMATLGDVGREWAKLLPGVAFAITVLWVTQRRPHPAVIPAVSLGAIALF